jgi:hypothetical protein
MPCSRIQRRRALDPTLGAWLRGLMTRMHKNAAVSRAGQQAGAYGLGRVTTQRDVPFRRLGDDIIRIGRLRIAMR